MIREKIVQLVAEAYVRNKTHLFAMFDENDARAAVFSVLR
jgi:hypothetical protein